LPVFKNPLLYACYVFYLQQNNFQTITKKGGKMEFVGIEKQMFEEMVRKFEQFEQKVMEICNQRNDKKLNKWMDNQEVCNFLNISPRTLQTLRDNGTLPFSQIKHKMFYKPEDVQNIAIRIKNNPRTTKKRV
jgi:carbamoylphosphate synthase small subunit